MAKKTNPKEKKPIQLKEVVIKGKRPVKQTAKQDSVTVGTGAGAKKFAVNDIKSAVRSGQTKASGGLKIDTTSTSSIKRTAQGSNDKADSMDNAIKKTKHAEMIKKKLKK